MEYNIPCIMVLYCCFVCALGRFVMVFGSVSFGKWVIFGCVQQTNEKTQYTKIVIYHLAIKLFDLKCMEIFKMENTNFCFFGMKIG